MIDDNSKLPAGAHARILALVDQEQQAHTLSLSAVRQIGELQKAIGLNPHGDKAAAWEIEVNRLRISQQQHHARHRALADLNARVRHYFATLPADVAIEDARRIKPKLKGETHQQAVARIRDEIEKLIAERTNVQSAGLPIDELKAQAKRWIVERAFKGRPAITATHERFDVAFSCMDGNAFTPSLDVLALLAWFDPEHLEAKLIELIDELPKPKLAMTPTEKAKRLASIASELLDLERLEIAHIDAAQDEGTIIPVRGNIDPQALLGIVVSRSKANAA